jgi:3-phenylpropionate/cinnamic acid dioxygenase small subunit
MIKIDEQEKLDNNQMKECLEQMKNDIEFFLSDFESMSEHEQNSRLRDFILFELKEKLEDLCVELNIVD